MTYEEEDRPSRRLTYRAASSITPSRPEWIWERWLASGALHLLIGRQGGGKSTLAAWLVATASAGAVWPGMESDNAGIECAVLSLEEPGDRLVGRLRAAGGDLDKVDIIGDMEDLDDEGRPFRRPWSLPGDCGALEVLITERNIGLLTVDGLGYSIKDDSHNYATVGAALSSLAAVAERTGCAIVGLVHPPKGGSDAVTAAIGSTAWTAIPRVCWVLGADPEDESGATRVVRVSKTNYREPDHGYSFTISNNEEFDCGVVDGISRSDVTAEELVSATENSEDRTARSDGRSVVKSILDGGPMDTSDLLKLAAEAGVSERTVRRARVDLGVISEQRKDPATGRVLGWTLSLPSKRRFEVIDGGVNEGAR